MGCAEVYGRGATRQVPIAVLRVYTLSALPSATEYPCLQGSHPERGI